MKKLIVISIIGVCIWLAYQYPHAMLNPGELSQGHQKLDEKCLECHKAFWGIDSKKCITCHKLSEIGKDTTGKDTTKRRIAFYQNLADQSCTVCHSEHSSRKPILNFSHEVLTEAQMKNCKGCHIEPDDNLHRQVSPECKSCHNFNGWKYNAVFNHELISSPAAEKNNCSSCHAKPSDNIHSP